MRPDPAPAPPHYDECPATGCTNTEDLDVMELAPGYTWFYSSTVCGHVAWVYWDPYVKYWKEKE
jgi:hypothetical protein